MGAAGAAATLEAAACGSETLVVERASGGGGVTAMAAGHLYMGGGTRVQQAVGIEDSAEDMFAYLVMNTVAPDEDKIRLYCDESASHFDWLVDQGVPFNDTMYQGKHVLQMTDECLIWSGNEEAWPFREKARPAPRGHKVAQVGELGGARMMECLLARAEELGVRIGCDAWVHDLVRDGDRIAGVAYRVFGEERGHVRARDGVIPATGQFTANEEMLAEHLPALHGELSELIGYAGGADWERELAERYPRMEKISIDYGVMERCPHRVVVETDFDWDDVGSWISVAKYLDRDGRVDLLAAL